MIDVRRHAELRRHPQGDEHVRIASGSQARDAPLGDALAVSGGLCEVRLPPAGRLTPAPNGAQEIVTYVHSGALEVRAVDGAPAIAYAGEFLHSALPSGVHDGELRASTTAFARVFRISLHRQEASLVRASARTRFTAAQRRNKICVAASPDARAGSLKTNHDVIVCSSILDVGHHLAYPVGPRRTVWMHVVDGSAEVGELVLREGDSVGVYDEPWVSCVAQCSSEVLLIDIGPEDSVGHHNDVDLSF